MLTGSPCWLLFLDTWLVGARPRLQNAVVQKMDQQGDANGSCAPAPISTSQCFPCFHKSALRENHANSRVDPYEMSVDVAFTLRHSQVSCHVKQTLHRQRSCVPLITRIARTHVDTLVRSIPILQNTHPSFAVLAVVWAICAGPLSQCAAKSANKHETSPDES